MRLKAISYTLLLLTFLFSTIDTHLFVYPSLSRSLITELVIAIMGCIILCKNIVKGTIALSYLDVFIILWIGYIILNSYLNASETYRVYYLVCSLAFCLIVSLALQSHSVTVSKIGNVILIVGGIQVLTIFLQVIGIADTPRGFRATGLYESPTPTALFLAGCCPIILERLCFVNKKLPYGIPLCLTLLALLVLGCRTAWIGMLVVAPFYAGPIIRSCWKGRQLRIKKKYAIISISLACLLIYFMYSLKKASSDSRLFIWQRSLEMIADRPMGYGYGLFERNYNLWQAGYFAPGKGTDKEKLNAEMTITPYNDIIEECVEGGIIGGLFYVSLFVTAGIMAWRQKDRVALSIIVSFFIMSQTNYLYTSDSAWLLLMSVLGAVSSKDRQKRFAGRNMTLITSSICILCLALIGIHETRTINAQRRLKSMSGYIKEGRIIDENLLTSLSRNIETSELYYTMSARSYLNARKPAMALEAAKTAATYTSKPEVYYLMAKAEMMSGDVADAVSHLRLISNMQPHHLQPLVFAMRILAANSRTSEAMECAGKILSMPVKVKSEKAFRYKEEARSYMSTVKKGREL